MLPRGLRLAPGQAMLIQYGPSALSVSKVSSRVVLIESPEEFSMAMFKTQGSEYTVIGGGARYILMARVSQDESRITHVSTGLKKLEASCIEWSEKVSREIKACDTLAISMYTTALSFSDVCRVPEYPV
jgi:hypothetical protein